MSGRIAFGKSNDHCYAKTRQRPKLCGDYVGISGNGDIVWRVDVIGKSAERTFRAAQQANAGALAFPYACTQMNDGIGAVARVDRHLVSGYSHDALKAMLRSTSLDRLYAN